MVNQRSSTNGPLRVLVTGGRGGVGQVIERTLRARGHNVTTTDLGRPDYETGVAYRQADLNDAAQAQWVVHAQDVVVHAAAIPDPTANAPHEVFGNNVLSTFHLIDAAERAGVTRVINISSETVLGFHYAIEPFWPALLPLSEKTPTLPQDPYGLSKFVGEQILEAVTRRGRISGVSLRPSWVQYPSTYFRNLADAVQDPNVLMSNLWSYTDADDLADAVALACEAEIVGHVAMFVVNPDPVGGHDLRDMIRRHSLPIRVRDDWPEGVGAVDCALAAATLGWHAQRTWRDHVAP